MNPSKHHINIIDYNKNYKFSNNGFGYSQKAPEPNILSPTTSTSPKLKSTTTTTTRRYIINPIITSSNGQKSGQSSPPSSSYRTTTTTIRSNNNNNNNSNTSNRHHHHHHHHHHQHQQQQPSVSNIVTLNHSDYNNLALSTRLRSSSLNRKTPSNNKPAVISIINYRSNESKNDSSASQKAANSILAILNFKKNDKKVKNASSSKYEKQKVNETPFVLQEQKQHEEQKNVENTSSNTKNDNNKEINYIYIPSTQKLEEIIPSLTHSLSYDSSKTYQNYNQINIPEQNLSKEPIKRPDTLDIKNDQQVCKQTNKNSFDESILKKSSTSTKIQSTAIGLANEYRVSVNIGNFNINDINIQLIDEPNQPNVKLIIHCLKIEPFENIVGNYLKKEFKHDVYMPKNVDVNTLETYFFNNVLTFTCKYKQSLPLQIKPPQYQTKTKDETTFAYNSEKIEHNHNLKHSSTSLNNSNQQCSITTRSILKTNSQNQVQSIDNLLTNNNITSRSSSNTNVDFNQWTSTSKNSSTNQSPVLTPAQSSNNVSKSVRFEEEEEGERDKQSEEAQEYNSALYGVIRDGFNCLTKDSLENVYLTYFFKLPSCSPSDRTQVKVENHSILRLTIIQEKKMKETSVKIDGNALKQVDDTDKIMCREFSRRCRLPTNLFKFDEDNVTISFMNDVWVRVEIPIIEFVTLSTQAQSNNNTKSGSMNNNSIENLKKSTSKSTSKDDNTNYNNNNNNNNNITSENDDITVSETSNSESIIEKKEIRF